MDNLLVYWVKILKKSFLDSMLLIFSIEKDFRLVSSNEMKTFGGHHPSSTYAVDQNLETEFQSR